jgi:non-ribosomal peptide synthetase component F
VPAELLAMRASAAPVPAGCEDFLAAVRAGGQPAPVELSMDDVALMTYTSGTTGLPKGAMLSYENARYKTAASADCNGMSAGEVLLAVAPLYHIAGMVMGVNLPVYTGATCVLLYRFDPLGVAQALQQPPHHLVVQHRAHERRAHAGARRARHGLERAAPQPGDEFRHHLHRAVGAAVAPVRAQLRLARGGLRPE